MSEAAAVLSGVVAAETVETVFVPNFIKKGRSIDAFLKGSWKSVLVTKVTTTPAWGSYTVEGSSSEGLVSLSSEDYRFRPHSVVRR